MSIHDLRPKGFTEHMRSYANMVSRVEIYPQGIDVDKFAVWLRIGGTQSMIAYGDRESVIAEARERLNRLLDELPESIAVLRP